MTPCLTASAISLERFILTHPDPDIREGFTETLRLRRELERCMRGLLDATTELEIARFGLYVERNATATARGWRVVVEAWEGSRR